MWEQSLGSQSEHTVLAEGRAADVTVGTALPVLHKIKYFI
jgi:hypothetical protein